MYINSMFDRFVYKFLDLIAGEHSPFRDSMFWYIIIITIIFFGTLIWGITR